MNWDLDRNRACNMNSPHEAAELADPTLWARAGLESRSLTCLVSDELMLEMALATGEERRCPEGGFQTGPSLFHGYARTPEKRRRAAIHSLFRQHCLSSNMASVRVATYSSASLRRNVGAVICTKLVDMVMHSDVEGAKRSGSRDSLLRDCSDVVVLTRREVLRCAKARTPQVPRALCSVLKVMLLQSSYVPLAFVFQCRLES